MRRAQLRLRQLSGLATVALLVVAAAAASAPNLHPSRPSARVAAERVPLYYVSPVGRRWF